MASRLPLRRRVLMSRLKAEGNWSAVKQSGAQMERKEEKNDDRDEKAEDCAIRSLALLGLLNLSAGLYPTKKLLVPVSYFMRKGARFIQLVCWFESIKETRRFSFTNE